MQVAFEYPSDNIDILEEASLAIRKDDWAAIHQAIADAIEPVKPRGWRKALHTLREWGILGVVATIIVALLGLTAGAFYQATTRIVKETTFETNTTRDLQEIRADIQAIRGDLTKQSVTNHASLPLPDFEKTLPELNSAIKESLKQDLTVSPVVMDSLKEKLVAVNPDAQSYWETIATLINYQSWLDQKAGQAPDPLRVSKPCNVVSRQSTGGIFYSNTISGGIFEGCIVDLDTNTFKGTTFKNCVVRYHGGPVSLQGVTFGNCRFVLNVALSANTPDQDRILLTMLKAPNLGQLKFSTH